ncbi:MAG TPA: single-stranded-DNA-specific exonuclease RecJ [Rhodospirillaceae bacterium]|nr:MAG: single-stranded-DNA-specific exonuclease RecJ [Alphaproteobacteria bacterium GWF2_58_20]HAU29607.1 single-stranded-DNA-specific exonuclease RecJ [Rhodospirillaceae bacterium]
MSQQTPIPSKGLSGRSWVLRPHDPEIALAMSQKLDIPEIMARVMAGRGVGLDEAEDFLDPSFMKLMPDPSTFKDMDKAAMRIAQAIRQGELVAILGDYDVDGATSAALLYRFIRAAGGKAMTYIPDRLEEGYGPNPEALLGLREKGAGLIVTVDCGATAFESLDVAANAGIDVVVIDHHDCEPRLPKAVAVVDPNRVDEDGAYSMLAAVGVVFLAVVAVNRILRKDGHYGNGKGPNLFSWVDLAGLGTVCDVVPLRGLNRAYVQHGLVVMAQRSNIGIAALMDVSRVSEKPSAYHMGFVLGPRINAGGRVGTSGLGVQLLTTEKEDEAKDIAARLDAFNTERREIEAQVQVEAEAQVEEGKGLFGRLVFVCGKGWHPGVVGIVASRLKEKYGKPACVVALEDGVGKASARSVAGFDIGAGIIAARQAGIVSAGGGHPMAAGFTVEAQRCAELAEFLASRLDDEVGEAELVPPLHLDGAISIAGATPGLLGHLEKLAPYGTGNPEPRFWVSGAQLVRSDIIKEKHVRCIFADPLTGARIKAMAFRSVESDLGRSLLAGGGTWHIAGRFKLDDWSGKEKVEMLLDDAISA